MHFKHFSILFPCSNLFFDVFCLIVHEVIIMWEMKNQNKKKQKQTKLENNTSWSSFSFCMVIFCFFHLSYTCNSICLLFLSIHVKMVLNKKLIRNLQHNKRFQKTSYRVLLFFFPLVCLFVIVYSKTDNQQQPPKN